jgi:hypothetical protein
LLSPKGIRKENYTLISLSTGRQSIAHWYGSKTLSNGLHINKTYKTKNRKILENEFLALHFFLHIGVKGPLRSNTEPFKAIPEALNNNKIIIIYWVK